MASVVGGVPTLFLALHLLLKLIQLILCKPILKLAYVRNA